MILYELVPVCIFLPANEICCSLGPDSDSPGVVDERDVISYELVPVCIFSPTNEICCTPGPDSDSSGVVDERDVISYEFLPVLFSPAKEIC